jgi:peptidoglycan/xylan/chitin deacetylase (PgdA/CDA1 family)
VRIPSVAGRIAGSLFRWSGIVSLNYHRIGDGRRSLFDRGLWSATEESFDAQVRWLKAHFDIVSPDDIPYVRQIKRGRHVIITFDDGFLDNFTAGYPILKSRNAKATFFITTGFIDRMELPWWDKIAWMVRTCKRPSIKIPKYLEADVELDEPDRERAVRTILRAYKKLPAEQTAQYLNAIAVATGSGHPDANAIDLNRLWMTWEMLREMSHGGMTIGGHGVSHSVLSRMSYEQQFNEIETCRARIADELKASMRTFAYPVGSRDAFNADTRSCLERCDVKAAFSYYGGFRKFDEWDDFDIPRLAIEQDMSFDEFRSVVLLPQSL